MKELNELVELAKLANVAGQGSIEMIEFRVVANPDTILAIAEAFRELEQHAEAAEKERDRRIADYKHLVEQHMPRTSDGCDEGWSRVIEARELQVKLEAAEAKLVPDGWKLVPVEPTKEMLDSQEHEMLPMVHHDSMRERARMIRRHGWRVMLAAAPEGNEPDA
ncbi:hypothetical protein [Pantoea agglomerans]|uniref:hypothetical protein n=1 Tax=Enterobacter agglomerans TaxID=549 RepID=UPI003C7BB0DF